MKKEKFFAAVVLIAAIAYIIFSVLGSGAIAEQTNGDCAQEIGEKSDPVRDSEAVALEIPKLCFEVRSQEISHMGYTVSYNSDRKIPNWVAWDLTVAEANADLPRKDRFTPDPDVVGEQALDKDYRNSGYDRGHMAPAADMRWSSQAMRESFYLSNICPQNHNLNAGDWKSLEEKCRTWAEQFSRIYITAGPVYEPGLQKTIGPGNVVVPKRFFKAVLARGPRGWQSIGFIFENAAGHRPLRHYALTVDSLEEITGLDFFYSLDRNLQQSIEASFSLEDWAI